MDKIWELSFNKYISLPGIHNHTYVFVIKSRFSEKT